MVVVCDGMIRSGSTWAFNVALELIKATDPHQKTFGLYSENPAVLLAAVRPRASNLVIKFHKLETSTYELLNTAPVKAIYTWRHPYDSIISAVRMFGHTADYWISSVRNSLRTWSFHKATGTGCIVPYESIISTPLECIRNIGSYLSLDVQAEKLVNWRRPYLCSG